MDTQPAALAPASDTKDEVAALQAIKRMGAATWDRLCHGAWRVRCEWPSYRKSKRNVNC
jgi:hypothetical protein